MISELFLTCALSLPSANATRPAIVSWHAARNEEDQLIDWMKKHNEIDDAFITPEGQENKLKEHGWERVPFTINGKQVWIQRKPKSDAHQKRVQTSA